MNTDYGVGLLYLNTKTRTHGYTATGALMTGCGL